MNILLILIFLSGITAFSGWLFSLAGSLKRDLHLLQLEDYEPRRMLAGFIRQASKLNLLSRELFGMLIICIASYLAFGLYRDFFLLIPLGFFYWGISCYTRFTSMRKKLYSAKKKLVMTARAKRIFLTAIFLTAITISVFGWTVIRTSSSHISDTLMVVNLNNTLNVYIVSLLLPLIAMYLIERFSPLILALSVVITSPIEISIQRRYLNDAKRVLKEINPMVIGITGSYGKTSVKEILNALLVEKYNVFRPPGSYNTLMGVTRVIREGLRPYHEAFIVEMGAYRKGSIAKLCDLTSPKYGIITTIGVQHLERFKSRENIRDAKAELVRALPEDGVAVLNADDEMCRQIAADFSGETLYFSVTDADSSTHAVVAQNISIGSEITTFTLRFADGEEIDVRMPLLGRSAVANTTAAVAMADHMGVQRKVIAKTLASLPQVRHRLELIKKDNGINVIDDAFNSNPVGASHALEVLSKANSGKRILITPGMVELGELEKSANHKFGREAAKSCDLVILVGRKRVEPIKKGLLDNGFDEEDIWKVDSLNAGMDGLKYLLKPGDTILLENDLPDQYDKL